jgi:hypothetical protein
MAAPRLRPDSASGLRVALSAERALYPRSATAQVHTEQGDLLTWPAGGANVVKGYAAEGAESLTAVTTLRRAFRTHDERGLDERLDEGFAQLKELHKAMGALQVGARSSVARRPNDSC